MVCEDCIIIPEQPDIPDEPGLLAAMCFTSLRELRSKSPDFAVKHAESAFCGNQVPRKIQIKLAAPKNHVCYLLHHVLALCLSFGLSETGPPVGGRERLVRTFIPITSHKLSSIFEVVRLESCCWRSWVWGEPTVALSAL